MSGGSGPRSPQGEQTTWSPGLIGFYVSCGVVSLGAAVTATVSLVEVLYSVAALVVGLAMVVGGAVGCLVSLRAARRED